jgi:hypothetical protein
MTNPTPSTTREEDAGPGLLGQFITARTDWLNTVIGGLTRQPFVVGAWLVGSMWRGEADAFSDVDLVVAVDDTAPHEVITDPVAELGLPGVLLYRRPKPRNAPAAGGYLAIGVELAGLPLLVDVFVWPAATAAVPAGARVLVERGGLPRSNLSFVPLLDAHRTSDTCGSDPQDPGTVLMLVQLAAKYLVRGNAPKLDGICQQLVIRTDGCDTALLRQVLDQRIDTAAQPQTGDAVRAVHRLLDVVDQSIAGAMADGQPRANSEGVVHE